MIAEWINTTFYGFDYSILEWFHSLAENAGGFFTPFANFLAVIGDNGSIGLLIAIILILFPKGKFCLNLKIHT